jgi:hypothetical protein
MTQSGTKSWLKPNEIVIEKSNIKKICSKEARRKFKDFDPLSLLRLFLLLK